MIENNFEQFSYTSYIVSTMIKICSFFVFYYSISYYFLKNPLILWSSTNKTPKSQNLNNNVFISKPNRNKYNLILGAHRGGSAERPENSLEAFDFATENQCELLELDVQITKDKEVVVSHDATLFRCCGEPYLIKDLNYGNLPLMSSNLQLVKIFNHSSGQTHLNWEPTNKTDENQIKHAYQLPKLKTVINRYPQSIVNIDMKSDDPELMHEVIKILDECNGERKKRIVWGSVHQRISSELLKLRPHQNSFFSGREVVKVYLLYTLGLLPFFPLRHTHFEVPLLTRPLKESFAAQFGDKISARMFFKFFTAVNRSPSLYSHLKQRGVTVGFWVLNSEEEFDYALEMGADIVMTDRPTILRNWAQKREILSETKYLNLKIDENHENC